MLRVVYPGRSVVLWLLLAAVAVVCPAQFTPFDTGTYAAKVISHLNYNKQHSNSLSHVEPHTKEIDPGLRSSTVSDVVSFDPAHVR